MRSELERRRLPRVAERGDGVRDLDLAADRDGDGAVGRHRADLDARHARGGVRVRHRLGVLGGDLDANRELLGESAAIAFGPAAGRSTRRPAVGCGTPSREAR